MATDPSEFVSIFSPGGTKLTLPPASPAGSEAGGVGSAQSSQTPAQQGAAGSVVQKILGGPSGSIGSVGGGSDTAAKTTKASSNAFSITLAIAALSGWQSSRSSLSRRLRLPLACSSRKKPLDLPHDSREQAARGSHRDRSRDRHGWKISLARQQQLLSGADTFGLSKLMSCMMNWFAPFTEHLKIKERMELMLEEVVDVSFLTSSTDEDSRKALERRNAWAPRFVTAVPSRSKPLWPHAPVATSGGYDTSSGSELPRAQHTHGPRPASRRHVAQRIRDRYARREA